MRAWQHVSPKVTVNGFKKCWNCWWCNTEWQWRR